MDHAFIVESDIEWLHDIEALTLWNVDIPNGFLKKLPSLWWLDIRGGSGLSVDIVEGLHTLKYLQINQVRGMSDLNQLTTLESLEYLSLYGLPKVSELPSFHQLRALERLDLGMLKGLSNIKGALNAPSLKELLLSKNIMVTTEDVDNINHHPSLKSFFWNAVDVPIRQSKPVIDNVELPLADSILPEKWFQARSES